MKISILHNKNFSPNEICFLYPLVKYKKILKVEFGITLDFINNINKISSDIIILSSRWFSDIWLTQGVSHILKLLNRVKSNTSKVIWYDISDSTGTTHFMLLPYVDLYLKNQIFSNKQNYLNKYYGSRIYSDFIYNKFQIQDSNEGDDHLNFIPEQCLLHKIKCGWNSGISYFGDKRHIQNYLFSKNPYILKLFKNKWVSPGSQKSIPVSCRLGTNYSRQTISESRHIILRQLNDLLPIAKISHKSYYKELKQSIAAVSPFGLGEISLRDFEVTINGAAMIKQDMSHLETWPNLWIKDKTYLDFKWDMSDIREKVEFAIENTDIMRELAHNAQSTYKEILDSKDSAQIFCERFKELIEG